MKTIPIALAAHYQQATTSLCQCLRMELRDGAVFAATSMDRPLTVDGVTYMPWLTVSDLVSTATLGVDNLTCTFVTDEVDLRSDLEAGRFDNASFYLFETNFLAPTDGVNGLKRGSTGEAQITDVGSYVLEFRGLTQALQQPVGIVTQKTCRAAFADYPRQIGGSPCRLDPADFTDTGSVTSVASNQVFSDSARVEADDYYTAGFLKFTDGLNAGYERQVRAFDSGVFTLVLPFPFTVEVGDAYSVIAGCQKRLTEDCKTKFSNVLNFQGEPHLPGVDAITKVPGVGS